MSKLVLVDGNAILHRAYHALPPLTTKSGKPINAVYGFVSMLLRVITDLKPTHLIVAFDRKEPTFRHKKFKKYQAHRPEMDKDLSIQFTEARKVVRAFRIPIYSKAGYEADDVIGTVAKKAEQKVNIKSVAIVTGDKDILQLVTSKTKVYLPVRGLGDAKLVGEKGVYQKMGVKPEQVVDFKALCGDPSDNYPGVPGIGPQTAKQLLLRYQTLEKIYQNLDSLSPL
jgi:DNA polymerase-1